MKNVLSRPVATDVKRTPWMERANAKGKHIVRKPPSPASTAGRHLPNWKTVHHLEKANQAAQLWRDDTLEAAGADGGEQPFINRGEMRADSHLQPAYSMTTLYCPARAHPDWKGLDQDN